MFEFSYLETNGSERKVFGKEIFYRRPMLFTEGVE